MKKYFYILFFIFSLGLNSQTDASAKVAPPEIMNPPPRPNFSFLNTCAGDTTKFINASLLANTYWWVVMDKIGDTLFQSTDTNIVFKFPAQDTFYVFLQCYNNHLTDITRMVVIGNTTQAGFDFQGCSNQFVNTSFCATSFFWDFGDGTTSTQELPVHLFDTIGFHTVTLIAWNGNQSDTLTQPVYVADLRFTFANFTWHTSGDTVFFHALDSVSVDYHWTLGDGTFALGQDTVHVYASQDPIPVGLLTRNSCGLFFLTDTIYWGSGATANPTSNPFFISQISGGGPSSFQYSITTDAASTALFNLTDITGRIIFSQSVSLTTGYNSGIISPGELATGIYFFTSINDSGKKTMRFLNNKGY